MNQFTHDSESLDEGQKRSNRGFARLTSLVLVLSFALLSYCFATTAVQQTPKSKADKLFARAKDEDFAGSTFCAECHEKKFNEFNQSAHSMFMTDSSLPANKRGCEGCHGPGKIHQAEENAEVIGFRGMDAKEASAACLRCHEKTLTPSHWKRTEHARADVSCVSCHQIHPDSNPALPGKNKAKDPRSALFTAKVDKHAMLRADEATLCGSCHPTEIGEFRNLNHHPVPEGSMVCSDCHSPHPTKVAKAKAGGTRNDCVSCHTELAGPFVYEHDPVAGNSSSGCVECHRPHGSNNTNMLRANSRGLCGQCHTEKLGSHYPNQSCWTAGCHVSLHGSNSDPHLRNP